MQIGIFNEIWHYIQYLNFESFLYLGFIYWAFFSIPVVYWQYQHGQITKEILAIGIIINLLTVMCVGYPLLNSGAVLPIQLVVINFFLIAWFGVFMFIDYTNKTLPPQLSKGFAFIDAYTLLLLCMVQWYNIFLVVKS